MKLFYLFPMQAVGRFSPLCAFLGGYAAQEAIKAITQKFSPTHQLFYYDAVECLPEFDVAKELLPFLEKTKDLSAGDRETQFQAELLAKTAKTLPLKGDRSDGLLTVVGGDLLAKLQKAKVFMVGAGALGCELIKTFAMMGLGCGEGGMIHCTDNDNIEISNLNRQFLFRQRHVGASKSESACAVAQEMNPALNCQHYQMLACPDTEYFFNDAFWESLDLVFNAVDNTKARIYTDVRCA